MECDLVALNVTLCKGVRLIVGVRRLAKDVCLDVPELQDIEREFRESAGEVQKYMQHRKDTGKPLILQ